MFEKIVVGIDGSEEAETALRLACGIADKFSSEIHLVHTPEPQTVAFAVGAVAGYHAVTTMPSDEDVQKASDKIVQSGMDVAQKYGQSIASAHTNRGHPVEEIVSFAKEVNADLIVTGRRGLGAVGSLIVGSTSQGVSHNAECAVLTIP